MTRTQKIALRHLARYDAYGAEDPIYYDTRNGNELRTLRVLADRGLIKLWEDMDEAGRWWAARLA